MALTLAAGISASDRYCTVNQPPSQASGSYYRIGDEVVQHIGYVTTTPIWSPTFTQLYIARAQLGTTAASHLSAAALTYVRPEFLSATAETDPGPFETGGAGGGGVTATDGTTTVDPALAIEFPAGSLTDAGDGLASYNGGGVVGPLDIHGTDPAQRTLVVQGATAQTNDLVRAVIGSGIYFSVGPNAVVLGAQPSASQWNITPTAASFVDENGDVQVDIEGGYIQLGIAGAVFISPSGYLVTSNHAAPADAEISPGDMALWFDQTNGAAKLMVKAKQADGTVRTGSLSLT